MQITLDGTEKVYNRVKNYIYNNNESPYKIVLNNMEKLLDNNIQVIVRLNMDEHNKDDLYVLVDELFTRFNKKDNFKIYVHLLYEDSGNLKLDYSSQKHLELAYDYFALEDYIITKGLLLERNVSNILKTSHCMADNDSSIVILPNGNLSKCEHALSEDIIGNIYSNAVNQEAINSWKQVQDMTESCYTCAVYPDCLRLKKCHSVKPICYKSEQLDIVRKKERMIWKLYENESK
ncbi:MAG: SPASM domain-containing protein [Clostridia bacterium]|nr:SPASM domain-containing protein [Clostridia bacterium]